ncbi:MAG TPA: sulfatase [Thermoanaerobaculia bacterium]|nr:sulfatase [Thermoanaerobaculia bacterium]
MRTERASWRRAVAGVACLAAAAACTRAPEPPSDLAGLATRGYILVSIDTLRADHLGAYGYGRDTSPFLDRLAARGVLFENAVVPLPGTLPSHMSMFTGLYPPEHGVYPPDKVLSAEIETLPEAFRRHGFRTAGFTEGGYMSGHYGFARGFERFSDEFEDSPRDVERTLARGLDFLAGLGADEPFFLFVHTYAVHDPYDPPEPFRSRYWPRPPPANTFRPTGANLVAVNLGKASVTAEQVAYFEALYDGGIRYLDGVLEQWFGQLDDLGLLADTTIVITSDHGEEFLEHGKLVHEQIYHENLHVPLIVLHPALPAGRRVQRLVRTLDLAPTLHELAGLDASHAFSGEPLPLRAARAPQLRTAYAESFDRSSRALYQDGSGADPDELAHVLLHEVPGEPHGTWVSGGVTFDAYERDLSFRAASFHQERRVQVLADDQPLARLTLRPEWQRVHLDLPGDGGKTSVELRADGCTSPSAIGLNADPRCLSFLVDGLELTRSELFLPHRDPREQNDVSADRPRLHRQLVRALQQLRFEEAAGTAQPLSDELRERLKSLGYLQ